MRFSETSEFSKELKRYSEKYRSLTNDVERFRTLIGSSEALEAIHFFEGNQATKLQVTDDYQVIKARLDCADLGNKQVLRVVYINTKQSVIFVELYSKKEKNREDTQRIKQYLKNLK